MIQNCICKAEDEYKNVGTISKHLCKFREKAMIFNSYLALLLRSLTFSDYMQRHQDQV